ncbi:MAG: hypothetical protein B7733_00485 [Myxococcales bacterium FL481]|nr:MAG: hypothetical protein B7733_00485 [Myxococcales bacterium FL481]
MIEEQTVAIVDIDLELAALDEGRMVRALTTSEDRGESLASREPLLVELDRLRCLEGERALDLRESILPDGGHAVGVTDPVPARREPSARSSFSRGRARIVG